MLLTVGAYLHLAQGEAPGQDRCLKQPLRERSTTEINNEPMPMLHLMNPIKINIQLIPGMKDKTVKLIAKRLDTCAGDEILSTNDRLE